MLDQISGRPARWHVYLLAMGLTALTLAFRLTRGSGHGESPGFILLIPPIIVALYVGGMGVIVFRDRTERVHTDVIQRECALLREQLSRIAANAPGIICAFRLRPDGTSCYPYASTRIRDIFGCAPEMLAHDASPALAAVHPDDRERLRVTAAESAAVLGEWAEEFRVLHPTKGEIWVESRLTPEHEADGSTLWRGFLNDISAGKRSEQALRASDERFRQIAESIREVFWLTDPVKGRIVYVSPAYQTIWGRDCESLLASSGDWLESIHPDDRVRVREAAETRQILGTYNEEYRIVRPDGTVRWVRDRAFPVCDAGGHVIRIAGAVEDITEARQLEAQLRQAQKMESIGLLAGGLAHDFNNWLTVILGSAELLRDTEPGGPLATEAIDEIAHACDRAASLTRQLLAFSRKDAIEPRIVDFNALVVDTEKLLRRLLGERIVLTSKLDPAIGRVKVDTSQWVQVLLNLCVNARDAMPEGGRLTITTAPFTVDEDAATAPAVRGGRYVKVIVADTGAGMPPAVRARIFEPFFTTKAVGRGTGLGLAVVYGIVKQSGGYVDVSSEEHVGTRFTMYIPTVEAVPLRAWVPPNKPEVGGGETILLVEDEASLSRLAARALRRHGYAVLPASSGQDALQIMNENAGAIDLLLTDVVMPGITGRELVDEIRKHAPGIGVLYTSGYTSDEVVRHGIHGADAAFLQKPYSLPVLLDKVREVLAAREHTRAA